MSWKNLGSFFNQQKHQTDETSLFERAESLLQSKKYSQAADIYANLAQKNHARAMVRLSTIYHDGNGVHKNYGIAMALLHNASERLEDNGAAQSAFFLLGAMYDQGHGCSQSDLNAHISFSIAQELGMNTPVLTRNNEVTKARLQIRNSDLVDWVKRQIDLSYAGFLTLILELKRNGSDRQDRADMEIYDSIKYQITTASRSELNALRIFYKENVEHFLAQICFIQRPFIQDATVLQIILLLNEAGDHTYARKLLDVIVNVWLRAVVEYACPEIRR